MHLGSEGVDSMIPAYHASRMGYAQWLAYFDGRDNLPASVMKVKKHKVDSDHDREGANRSYYLLAKQTSAITKLNSKEMQRLKMSSATGVRKGALSTFPQALCRTMVLFYTKPGDIIVDPFAGHNSRMEATVKAGRSYHGQDLSAKFMEYNRIRAKQLRSAFPKASIQLFEGDSRKLQMETNSGDFTITSPPYWDVEDYGPEKEQLGKSPLGYEGFLHGIRQVLRENLRVLKPGCFAVWYINDIRKKGFIPYHRDIMNLGEAVGFQIWDTQIVDFGRSHRDCFVNQFMQQKILPKRHEYGVVFRKPLTAEMIAAEKAAKKAKKAAKKSKPQSK